MQLGTRIIVHLTKQAGVVVYLKEWNILPGRILQNPFWRLRYWAIWSKHTCDSLVSLMVKPQEPGIPGCVNAIWGSLQYPGLNFPMSGRLIDEARPLRREAMFATSGINISRTNTFALVVCKEFPWNSKLWATDSYRSFCHAFQEQYPCFNG